MDQFSLIWQNIFPSLCESLNPAMVNSWLRVLEPVSIDKEKAVFSVPSNFQKEIIQTRYISPIEKVLKDAGFDVKVEVISAEEQPYEESGGERFVQPKNLGIKKTVFDDYRFDNFIVGSGNKFAHAASVAVATQPGYAYNPLFIYGASGLGKTHLLCAIGNKIKKDNSDASVVYVTGEQFSNELIAAIQNNTTLQFKNRYRMADILLVDDIQFIGGKESIQEEFFHTFNTLYNAKKQIVLTSDRPTREIQLLDDRLRTRFDWGLPADIQPPDYETRCAIVNTKCKVIGLTLPPDVVEFIAQKLKTNVRQIEGAVMKIKALSVLTGRKIEIGLVSDAIKDVVSDNVPISTVISNVIEEVAKFYNLSPEDLKGKKRTSEIANARQIAMYVIREITELSLPLIGEYFGGRDHTTVLYALRKVDSDMAGDVRLRAQVSDFISNLKK